jgi:hypothetical protein
MNISTVMVHSLVAGLESRYWRQYAELDFLSS